MGNKILTPDECTKISAALALSYYNAYNKKIVKDGSTYAGDWKFAKGATYWSPYFGNKMINLELCAIPVADSASMEALSYSAEFNNWGPLDFNYWATPSGVAWKTHFGGYRKSDGVMMDFFAYSYLDVNDYGEITHWETHVNSAYDRFLDVAIGTHGPFPGPDAYMAAVNKKLNAAGIDFLSVIHKSGSNK